jgi:hypothetical protein
MIHRQPIYDNSACGVKTSRTSLSLSYLFISTELKNYQTKQLPLINLITPVEPQRNLVSLVLGAGGGSMGGQIAGGGN